MTVAEVLVLDQSPTPNAARRSGTLAICAVATVVTLGCASIPPPPPPSPPPAPAPAEPKPAEPSPWAGLDDIPCSAGPHAFLPALESRVLHRIRPPVGLVPLTSAGNRYARGLQVKVVMEIDRRGTIRRSAIARSSGVFELDRAVQAAIEEAECMPVPPEALLDERSSTFKISLGYLFRRG
jgi:TonB family protein